MAYLFGRKHVIKGTALGSQIRGIRVIRRKIVFIYRFDDSVTTGQFPNTLKSAGVKPLLKKPTLDPHILTNYRPVSNLSFLSKVIEKVIAKQLTTHMLNHDILEEFQSAYKANRSTETTLLEVFNATP